MYIFWIEVLCQMCDLRRPVRDLSFQALNSVSKNQQKPSLMKSIYHIFIYGSYCLPNVGFVKMVDFLYVAVTSHNLPKLIHY